MRRFVLAIAFSVIVGSTAGCEGLVGLFQPNNTNVILDNQGEFDVVVTLYFGDDQNALEAVLKEFGTRLDFTVAPGTVQSFSRPCGALQAVVIDKAELMVIGTIGPTASSDVFRDGSDFGCGDTIVFTFDHPVVPTDLTISTAVQQ